MRLPIIKPDWPAADHIFACTTTRHGGCSSAPFEALNVADHVGDDGETVAKNRAVLRDALQLVQEPAWLRQTHSTRVADLDANISLLEPFDASYSRVPGTICAVLTADCLPILVCDRAGETVAAIHAGWRGLAAGIIEQTLANMKVATHKLMVWIGPSIGQQHFEVGAEVREIFVQQNANTATAFVAAKSGRYFADLYAIACVRLQAINVHDIYGGDCCTYANPDKFFSYRRDKETGRMVSLITLGSADNA